MHKREQEGGKGERKQMKVQVKPATDRMALYKNESSVHVEVNECIGLDYAKVGATLKRQRCSSVSNDKCRMEKAVKEREAKTKERR